MAKKREKRAQGEAKQAANRADSIRSGLAAQTHEREVMERKQRAAAANRAREAEDKKREAAKAGIATILPRPSLNV